MFNPKRCRLTNVCLSLGDYQFDEALTVVVAGSHAGGCRVTPRDDNAVVVAGSHAGRCRITPWDDVGRAPFGGSSKAGCV